MPKGGAVGVKAGGKGKEGKGAGGDSDCAAAAAPAARAADISSAAAAAPATNASMTKAMATIKGAGAGTEGAGASGAIEKDAGEGVPVEVPIKAADHPCFVAERLRRAASSVVVDHLVAATYRGDSLALFGLSARDAASLASTCKSARAGVRGNELWSAAFTYLSNEFSLPDEEMGGTDDEWRELLDPRRQDGFAALPAFERFTKVGSRGFISSVVPLRALLLKSMPCF